MAANYIPKKCLPCHAMSDHDDQIDTSIYSARALPPRVSFRFRFRRCWAAHMSFWGRALRSHRIGSSTLACKPCSVLTPWPVAQNHPSGSTQTAAAKHRLSVSIAKWLRSLPELELLLIDPAARCDPICKKKTLPRFILASGAIGAYVHLRRVRRARINAAGASC